MSANFVFRDRTALFVGLRRQETQFGPRPSRQLPAPSSARGDRLLHDDASSFADDVEATGSLPPQYVDVVEEIEYTISQVELRIKELSVLHAKHTENPEFDEHKAQAEEREIEDRTRVIMSTFQELSRQIQRIDNVTRDATSQQQKTAKNIQQSVAIRLQRLSSSFRKSQSQYLKRLKTQQQSQDGFLVGGSKGMDEDDDFYDQGYTDEQIQSLQQNMGVITERQEEILNVLQSLNDLHTIFKEISTMVIDQGTLLDQIDYNVEQAQEHVEKAYEEQEKAEKYHKRSGKMIFIFLLIVAIITIFFIIVLGKWAA